MKLTLHHAAVDGKCGTESHLFPTQAALQAWLRSIIEDALEHTSADEEHTTAIRQHLAAGEIDDAWSIFEEHLKDPLETYALDQTGIEIPTLLAASGAAEQPLHIVIPASTEQRLPYAYDIQPDNHGVTIGMPFGSSGAHITADSYHDQHQTLVFDSHHDDPAVTIRFDEAGDVAEIEVRTDLTHLVQKDTTRSPWVESRDQEFENKS